MVGTRSKKPERPHSSQHPGQDSREKKRKEQEQSNLLGLLPFLPSVRFGAPDNLPFVQSMPEMSQLNIFHGVSSEGGIGGTPVVTENLRFNL